MKKIFLILLALMVLACAPEGTQVPEPPSQRIEVPVSVVGSWHPTYSMAVNNKGAISEEDITMLTCINQDTWVFLENGDLEQQMFDGPDEMNCSLTITFYGYWQDLGGGDYIIHNGLFEMEYTVTFPDADTMIIHSYDQNDVISNVTEYQMDFVRAN